MVRRVLMKRFSGREIDTAGDGFLAAFDGRARDPLRQGRRIVGRRARPRGAGGRSHR
jgi:hypothetical protein